MVLSRSQSKKADEHPNDDDTEPMEIDEDDFIFLPPSFEEVLEEIVEPRKARLN